MSESEKVTVEQLTREVAIQPHRELWDWLAKNPDKNKSDWPRWPDVEEKYGYINMICFACQIRYMEEIDDCVDNCLFIWPSVFCLEEDDNGNITGLYGLWLQEKDLKKRSELAEKIRDLPVRERKEN